MTWTCPWRPQQASATRGPTTACACIQLAGSQASLMTALSKQGGHQPSTVLDMPLQLQMASSDLTGQAQQASG